MTYLSDKEKAKLIRLQFKSAFPGIRSWVTSKNGIKVVWVDGPTKKAVSAIVKEHESIDKCEASGEILAGANTYIFCHRKYSEDALRFGLSKVKSKPCWSSIDFTSVEFKLDFEKRGMELVSKPEYAISDRQHLCDEVVHALRDVDFTVANETEAPAEATVDAIPDDKTQEVLETRATRFNGRRERRVKRYRGLSQKHQKESNAACEQSTRMASAIPFGQPILTDHYSAKRDRKYRERIRNKMDRSIRHAKTSKYYESKAEAAENNHAISSDDPEVIAKLKAEIASRKSNQERMKEANKIVRDKKLSEDQKILALNNLGHDGHDLMNPRYTYGQGYQSFQLQNNNAQIRRLEIRLRQEEKALKDAVALGDTEQAYPDHNLVVKKARSINRLQLKFKGKPSFEVRQLLKKNGFRWSRGEVAWQRFLKNSDYALASVLQALDNMLIKA